MKMSFRWILALAAVLAHAAAVSAQTPERRLTLSLGGGVGEYDLSGVDSAPLIAVRSAWTISRLFLTEGSFLYVPLDQQFGRSRLYVPEAQLQIRWPLPHVQPYLGAGVGVAIDVPRSNALSTDRELTLSGALGARTAFPGRVGLQVDLRVRGIGSSFEGSGAEATAGLTVRI